MPFKYPSMQERIIANTVQANDNFYNGSPCWWWIGKRTPGGYGQISVRFKRGPRKGKVNVALAHRVSLMVFKKRRLSPRMVAKHMCPPHPWRTLCCNPDHLVGGSQASNNRQTVKEGRHRGPHSKPKAQV